ncbi:HAUS augmin-like complex subunit 5 isoform 2-T2 [Morphnus guianensis]
MEIPPGLAPSGPVLRRLCSGSCAPIWEFITRHVRHPRTVKKIRGNLLWYRHLEETKGVGPAPPEGALSRLRQEVGGLGVALGGAQEAALELEAELGAGQSRRGAELRQGLELRLMGAAAARAGQRLRAGRGALGPPPGQWEAGPELEAAVAVGVEPEVLVSVRAVCGMRAEALEAGLEPRPPEETRDLMDAANERWLRAAKAVLSRHAPGAVLWALEHLARERTRPPRPRKTDLDPDLDPDLGPEAPPTMKKLIEESWGAVGGLWGRLPPLAARLPPLRLRLARLRQRLAQRLGGDPKIQEAARLALEVAWLTGARGALNRGVQKLRGGATVATAPPKFSSGEPRRRLLRARRRLTRRQRRLQALATATGTLKKRLRPLQNQVGGVAQAGLGAAPPALAREGERLRRLLGELGALGEPRPGPAPDPLLPACHALGLPPYKAPQGALCRAAALRQELRGRGPRAGPREGAGPPQPHPVVGRAVGGAGTELLPRLRLLAAQTHQRIEAWPRLQALISQWWEQPAQWTLAPPPGNIPFSHWMQRWTRAAHALPCPRPLPSAPPTHPAERRSRDKPHP